MKERMMSLRARNIRTLLVAFACIFLSLEGQTQKKSKEVDAEMDSWQKQDEIDNKKKIQDFLKKQSEIPGVKKLGIPLNPKSKYPYNEAYEKYSEQMAEHENELTAAEQVQSYNSIAESLGKTKITIDMKQKSPFQEAYAQNEAVIAEFENEIESKNKIEKLKDAFLKAKVVVNLKPNFSQEKPYATLYDSLLDQYPDIVGGFGYGDSETEKKMECATQAKNLFTAFEKQNLESGRCEADGGLSKTQYLSDIAKALKQVGDESLEQQAAREKATIEVLGNSGYDHSSRAIKLRQSYKDCGLTEVEIATVVAYTRDLYADMNQALREGGGKFKPAVDTLNRALKKLANYKGTVVRGASDLGGDVDLFKPGAIVKSKAFTSAAASGEGFAGAYRFTIQSCGGKYIAPLSASPGEEEVLFKSNTSFKVLSKKEEDYGVTKIKLKEICEK